MLDVRLFGQAVVSANDVPIKFSRRPVTLPMLGYLLLHRDRAVSREFLAYLLFPDADETTALAELRRYLYLAQKALPPAAAPWIFSDGETVAWNRAAPFRLDVEVFERLAADPATASEAADEYRGDLLEDSYDDWIVVERERLRARYIELLTRAVTSARADRDFARAVRTAGRLLAVDPWREDIVRELIAVRYESGDAAGALAEYEAFVKRLRGDLDVSPMPETLAIREAIVRNVALPGTVVVASKDGRSPPSRTPFVGRVRELDALRAAWQRAARGNGGLVLASGEAGVGKSRLAAEIARHAAGEGGRVFTGTTSAPERAPYQAFAEAFASALPLLLAQPLEPHHRAALAAIVPELCSPERTTTLPELGPAAERTRLFAAMAAAVKQLASPRPLLLVFEDLHWAGAATVEALGSLVRACARVPVLFLATAREEETPRTHPLRSMLHGFAMGERAIELHLDRFDRAETAMLVATSPTLRDRPGAADALFERSEGNALFLIESIAEAIAGDGEAGATIAAVVTSRLERISDEARTVAEIAAVAGAGCTIELVRDVAGLPPLAVARGFDELLDRRLLRETGARARYDYVFTHHLIADAVYGAIAEAARCRRHARLATVLESAYAGDASLARQIGAHRERCGERDVAAAWYVRAARGAAAVYAHEDAAELCTIALAMTEDAEARGEALGLRETAYGRLGERDARRADLAEIERLAGIEPAPRFDAAKRRVAFERSLGDASAEARAIDELEELARSLGTREGAVALQERATAAGLRSMQREAIGHARQALALYETLGDLTGQLECLCLLVDFSINTGELESAGAYLQTLQERAKSLADRAVEARALTLTAVAALHRQDYRTCLELSKNALALNRSTGDREGETASRMRIAVAAAWLGEYALSLHEFPLALEGYEMLDNKRGIALTLTNYATLLMRVGLLDEARETLARSTELFAIAGERRTLVANTSNASVIALLQGNPEKARTLARSALDDARAIGFPVFEAAVLANLANAEREVGRVDEAIVLHEASLDLRRSVQQPDDYIDDLADVTMTYVRAANPERALTTVRDLREAAERSIERAFWPQYVLWALSRGYVAAGDTASGARYAGEARAALAAQLSACAPTRAAAKLLDIALMAEIAASG